MPTQSVKVFFASSARGPLALAYPMAAAQEAPAPSAAGPTREVGRSDRLPWRRRRDAEQTREDLERVLGSYPPAVGRVLKLDPSLMNNPAYLGPYPALRPSSRSIPKSSTTRAISWRTSSHRFGFNDPPSDGRKCTACSGGRYAVVPSGSSS